MRNLRILFCSCCADIFEEVGRAVISKIAVLGLGTMGHGIAGTFAVNGYDVNIFDTDDTVRMNVKDAIGTELEFLVKNSVLTSFEAAESLGRVKVCGSLVEAASDVDYAIEAVVEDMEVKQGLFQKLDSMCRPDCIFASCTSGLLLDGMMEKVSGERRKRMLLCHWFNPPHLMPVVEISFFGNTSEELFMEVEMLYKNIGKHTVKVLKNVPGLVANRIQNAVAREVFYMFEQGIAAPEDIDKAFKYGPAFRYATAGPLEVADMGGLDIWCVTGDNLLPYMDDRRDANPVLRRKVVEGKLGIKSGEGFYKYPSENVRQIKERFQERLLHQLKASRLYED